MFWQGNTRIGGVRFCGIASGLIMGIVACEKKEGPMEKAGKEVDKTIEKTEKAIKEKTE